MKRITYSFVIAGVALLPTAANAEPNANSAFQMSASVPEFCEISASPLLASSGDGFVTGSVLETCNSQRGYSVVAAHRTLAASELVTFSYAGVERQLQSDGWSEVANRAGARYGVREISLRHTALTSPLIISLTVTAY